jgi:hypothetical protein
MTDVKTLAAMLMSEAAAEGISGIEGDALKRVMVQNDNALYSFVATITRLRFLEGIIIKTLVSTSKRPIEEIMVLKKQADLATAFHSVGVGALSEKEAILVCCIDSKHHDLIKKAAEAREGNPGKDELASSVRDLNAHMSKKQTIVTSS